MPFRLAQEEEGVFLVHEPRAEEPRAEGQAVPRPPTQKSDPGTRYEADPDPRPVQTWTEDELRELRKATGQVTELPWHRKPDRSKTTGTPSAQPGRKRSPTDENDDS